MTTPIKVTRVDDCAAPFVYFGRDPADGHLIEVILSGDCPSQLLAAAILRSLTADEIAAGLPLVESGELDVTILSG